MIVNPSPDGTAVLVTGATGYIGGRLVPRLLATGRRVRCLVRDPAKLAARDWYGHAGLEIVRGDAADPAALDAAMAGCEAAYYMIHSMVLAGEDYRRQDRDLAQAFAAAAERARLGRIIYLGGLGETGPGLSAHLGSRQEVADLLSAGAVPVTTLRAAMIIGSGSASFEILRYLVERLPAMITPRWVSTEAQPIAIRDTLRYLLTCLDEPATRGQTLDIGGPEVMSYKEIMQVMAIARGLPRRLILPVPVLTPRLSSLWIHLVTPADRRMARPLAEGLRNRVVCRDDRARELMPGELLSVDAAIRAALGKAAAGDPETSWLDAGPMPGDPDWTGGTVFKDERRRAIAAAPERVFAVVSAIGGEKGWYASQWLWRLRGAMDRLIGGPGLSRGRRHHNTLAYGDVVDFWRVNALEPGRRLGLRAEMRLPGEASLEFALEDGPEPGSSLLRQTARFKPRGLIGLLYWWAVTPFHGPVFNGMIAAIARRAEEDSL